jgi:monoterpene epsilon-lactone hydrolase
MPSLQHQLLTRVIPVLRRSSEVHDAEQVRRDVLARQARADPSPPRAVARRYEVARHDVHGMTVLELRVRGARPDRAVLYVHGGGFVSGLDRFHWRYAARLAGRLGVRVVLPTYPLTPSCTWFDATPPLLAAYDELVAASPGGVVLMGDSAGGGLALSLAQLLVARGSVLPSHLVLTSPWLELDGSTPGTEEAAAADPWLTLSKLRLYGTWWGAGDPPAAEASPLRGDLAGLPPALMFCGTRDLLVPQARELVARAAEAGWDLTYVEEPGLIHVFPLLPVPEAGPAFERTVAFLEGSRPGQRAGDQP